MTTETWVLAVDDAASRISVGSARLQLPLSGFLEMLNSWDRAATQYTVSQLGTGAFVTERFTQCLLIAICD
jgi:hypothetical protein